MKSGPPCSICVGENRDEIERNIVAGKSDSSIARTYKLAPATVGSHRKRCVPEVLARSRHAEDLRRGDYILAQADRLYREAIDVMERSKADRVDDVKKVMAGLRKADRERATRAAEVMAASDVMVLRSIREARPSLELLARVMGQIQDSAVVNIHTAPDFVELKAAILDALKKHPAAFLDVKDALLEFTARRQEGTTDVQPMH